MEHTLFFDTNALLNLGEKAFEENFWISQKTLEEIERIKSSGLKDNEVKYKARNLARFLDKYDDKYNVVPTTTKLKTIISEYELDESPDNIILAAASLVNQSIPVLVVSDDINVKFISRNIFHLKTKGIDNLLLMDDEEYTGCKEVTMTDEEMAYFYSHLNDNYYDLLLNQYLVVKNQKGDIVDNRRWNGTEYRTLSYKQINNDFMGRVKPRNNRQALAFDLIQNKDQTIKILSGKAGSGKDFIMLSNALDMIKQGKFDKLVYVRNPIALRDVPEQGYLPGELSEKLAPYYALLADHLGGQAGLDFQLMQGTIEIEHLGFIRGRSFNNSIVYVTEAENMTKDHIQLLISRLGEGSILMLNGDFKQVDSAKFRMNNGLMSAINKLKGIPEFGFIKLEKTERSKTAALADLLD